MSLFSNTEYKSKKPAKSVVCKPGFVNFNGRCMPQEQKNKKSNNQSMSKNNLIGKKQ